MMRPSPEQLYPVVVLAILAGLSFWIERSTRDEAAVAAIATPDDPDYVAEGARLVSFDQTGRQRYELVAEKMTHYPVTDIALLERPVLVTTQNDRGLRVSARSGVARQKGDEIFLNDDVHVWRQGIGGEADLTLEARTLTIWPDDERAASDAPVVISQGGTIAKGDALRADNLYGTLVLIGNTSVQMQGSTRSRP